MGKFFEAMQRAANLMSETADSNEDTARMRSLPELDAALLEPEGPRREDSPGMDHEDDAFADPPVDGNAKFQSQSDGMFDVAATESERHFDENWQQATAGANVSPVEPIPQHHFSSAKLVDTGVFKSPAHAAYERIIQRLLKFRKSSSQGVILVASAVANEGTSTVARNTAFALGRQEGERVLLIDAHMRNPALHKALKCEREIGLSDVLMGTVPLTKAIRDDDASEISFMTAGAKVPSPAQILSVAGFRSLLMGAMSLFDWVLIDGPPVTAYPDSASIASACAGAMLVIAAESTRSEVVEEANRILEATGVEMLGAVLNRRRYHIPEFIYRRL